VDGEPGGHPHPFWRARLRVDERLRAELDYCCPRGLSHSHFLGGPAVFTDDDQDKALAWQAEQASLCGGCGLPLAETTDPANEYAYETEALRCFACRAKHRLADDFKGGGGETGGLLLRVWRAVVHR
jgi:hypothetical protein